MDIHQLDPVVQRYFTAALTPSTHRTYKAAERRYLNFCKSFHLTPFPTTEAILCYYVACLGQEGLAHATIKAYLSGVRQSQIAQGFPEPHPAAMPRLQQVIRGVRVEQGRAGRSPRTRLPITPTILRKMKAVWEDEGVTQDTMMLWAASSLTFFAFCRSGEVTVPSEKDYDPSTHLSYEDIAVDNKMNPSMLFMRLKKTKTDPFREGVKITIGASGDDICPVAALLAYLAQRGSRPGPLFLWHDNTPLTKTQFGVEVRKALGKAKLPAEQFAGHSFRIGAATTAATVGIEDSVIQTMGRWKSAAYLLYVRLDSRKLATVSKVLSTSSL